MPSVRSGMKLPLKNGWQPSGKLGYYRCLYINEYPYVPRIAPNAGFPGFYFTTV